MTMGEDATLTKRSPAHTYSAWAHRNRSLTRNVSVTHLLLTLFHMYSTIELKDIECPYEALK